MNTWTLHIHNKSKNSHSLQVVIKLIYLFNQSLHIGQHTTHGYQWEIVENSLKKKKTPKGNLLVEICKNKYSNKTKPKLQNSHNTCIILNAPWATITDAWISHSLILFFSTAVSTIAAFRLKDQQIFPLPWVCGFCKVKTKIDIMTVT